MDRQRRECCRPRVGNIDLETARAQKPAQGESNRGFVIDHQNPLERVIRHRGRGNNDGLQRIARCRRDHSSRG